MGLYHPTWLYDKWSRVLTRVLRHDAHIRVSGHGFAYCEDILRAMSNREVYHLKPAEMPKRADLIHIVNTQEKGRYEATSLKRGR